MDARFGYSSLPATDRNAIVHLNTKTARRKWVHHRPDLIDVLVRLGPLLRQTLAGLGAGDDAVGLQFLVDPPPAAALITAVRLMAR
jgi:hypothetical protein